MILSNLTKLIPCSMGNTNRSLIATCGSSSSVGATFMFNIVDVGQNGNIKERMQYYNTNEAPYETPYNIYLNSMICVGSGTTPPTIDDTKLENAILNLDFLGGSCARSYQTITVTTTWQNNTGAPVTINELGIHITNYVTSDSSKYVKTPFVILTRTVLETPVVMQDGDSRTFSIAINFDKMLETATNG